MHVYIILRNLFSWSASYVVGRLNDTELLREEIGKRVKRARFVGSNVLDGGPVIDVPTKREKDVTYTMQQSMVILTINAGACGAAEPMHSIDPKNVLRGVYANRQSGPI